MPKGRGFAPNTEVDGVWFPHRGLPDTGPAQRESSTSTGLMLSSPYNAQAAAYPPAPPKPYHDKDTKNFKTANSFSAHDNRHSFQDHGVYFGDGQDNRSLGKAIIPPEVRQHTTEKEYLKHYGRHTTNYDYKTIYYNSFEGKPTAEPPSGRRFPKIYSAGNPGPAKLSTTTTTWHGEPEVPHKTPTHVLAVTQEPFLPPNRWRYSNHGRYKCYPPYDQVHPSQPFPTWTVRGIDRSAKIH